MSPASAGHTSLAQLIDKSLDSVERSRRTARSFGPASQCHSYAFPPRLIVRKANSLRSVAAVPWIITEADRSVMTILLPEEY